MANRNDPDVRQHETLPGLCPAPSHSLTLPGGARPVEQMMDAAIERIERGARERGAFERSAFERSAFERSAFERSAIERVPHEQQLASYDHDLERGQPPSSNATRLRWKGLDVSDEFREYAERIARGEDLPPFEGRVLAEPNAAFPWGSLSRSETPVLSSAGSVERPGRGGQLALWTSAAVVMALLGWSVALKLQAIDPPSALLDVAAPTVAVPPLEAPAAPSSDPSAAAALPRAAEEGVAHASAEVAATVPAAIEQPPMAASAEIPAGSAVPAAAVVPPATVAAEGPAPEPAPAAPSPAVAAGVAVSIAPALAEPLAAAPAPASPGASPAVAAPTPAPVPAPKPTASPRQDTEVDFGIDELPLPSASASGTRGQVSEAGNIGDLARVGQSGTGPARKEPGSESSAKGSLLVDKPSF